MDYRNGLPLPVAPLVRLEPRRRPAIPLEVRWCSPHRPLPTKWVIPEGRRAPSEPGDEPLDFGTHMHRLCADIAGHSPILQHIRAPQVLLSFTPARNRSQYGLQARVTPLRFREGGLYRRYSAVDYQVQRFFVDDVEMLYILAFCLPRFFDQSFEEKLSTVFHELFHMSPAFDGDLRRHKGRYAMHSHSKARYDSHMAALAKEYLANHDRPEVLEFLRFNYRELWVRHGGIRGVIVPRPKLLPVGWAPRQAARKT
jgi:predicted metallopeptidase